MKKEVPVRIAYNARGKQFYMQIRKPVFIMNSASVTKNEHSAVMSGVKTILKIIGLEKEIQINDLGCWNQGSGEHESIDWYLAEAQVKTANGCQIYDDDLLKLYRKSPLTKNLLHFVVMIIDKDLTSKRDDGAWYNFVIGDSFPDIGVVLSVKRFRGLSDSQKQEECIKTLVMHELGHVFLAASGRNGIDALSDQSNSSVLYKDHCDQECVMRQGGRVPDAWEKLSEDRLKSGKPFCKKCIDEMKRYIK
ncbi:MAG: hypothetical protein HZA48_11360 [Planctomycetes bacterium]|nr:hypothetical protein [Planctomycetota bacterium]